MTTTTSTDDTAVAMYAQRGHVCRLSWDDSQPVGDCPTCGDIQTTCNTDEPEVCFTDELVRRKLLLGRCPPCLLAGESQYDRVAMSAASTDVFMRTFKAVPTQSSGPCPPGTACWTSPQSGGEDRATVDRVYVE